MKKTTSNVAASEPTVTENLSLSGAAVFSPLDVKVGEFLRVVSEQYDVSIISVVAASISVKTIFRVCTSNLLTAFFRSKESGKG